MKKAILFILMLIMFSLVGCVENLDPKEKAAIETYKQEISQYLEEKYNEKFDVEYVEKGYKHVSLDGAIPMGKTLKHIKEYLYEFSIEKPFDKISCYVVYWYNTEDGTHEINEYEKNYYDYEKILEVYNNKIEIKEALEECIQPVIGNDYSINWVNAGFEYKKLTDEINEIDIYTQKSLAEITSNNYEKFESMYNKIKEIIKEQEFVVRIKTEDNHVWIDKDSNIEEDSSVKVAIGSHQIEGISEKLENCLNKYYKKEFTIKMPIEGNNRIEVTFNKSMYDMVALDVDKFIRMFDEIENMIINTDVIVDLKCKKNYEKFVIDDDSILSNKSLRENLIGYNKKMKIKEKLDAYLTSYIVNDVKAEYTANMNYLPNIIKIETNKPKEDIISHNYGKFKAMYNNISNLLKGTGIKVQIDYKFVSSAKDIVIDEYSDIESDKVVKGVLENN